MNTVVKIVKQEKFDRYVFLTYEEGQLIGLNFHQGLDEILYDSFNEPCLKLTKIYNKVCAKKLGRAYSENELVNLALKKYIKKYIIPKPKKIKIPNTQTRLIQKAIAYYVKGLREFQKEPNQDGLYDLFDLEQLKEMLNYDIHISITDIEKDNFSFAHGMDFPEYIKK